MGLTAKQERFCQEYVIDYNATQAAIRSGYSKKTAYSIGEENLRKPELKKRIEIKQEELRERSKLTADMVIQELRLLSFYNVNDFLKGENEITNLLKLSRKKTVPVVGIKTKITSYKNAEGIKVKEVVTELKLSDKRGSLGDLGRHLGIFEKDNQQSNKIIKVTRK